MNRWFKYIIVSTLMASSIFFLVYYQKGEYKYEVFLVMFILNVPVFFDKKRQKKPLEKGVFCLKISVRSGQTIKIQKIKNRTTATFVEY